MKLFLPCLVINFKAYKESTGKNALKLALTAEKIALKEKSCIVLAVHALDLKAIASKVKIPVFSQHVDAVELGARTGSIPAEAVRQAKASGTLLNHAEKKIPLKELEKAIIKAHEQKLKVITCASGLKEAKEIAMFKEKPELIAFEPPELIGSNVSVSKARPEVLVNTVNAVKKIDKKINVLCGAGIKNLDDAKKALELGSKGLLVASGIIKAKKPAKAIKELINSFKK